MFVGGCVVEKKSEIFFSFCCSGRVGFNLGGIRIPVTKGLVMMNNG